MHQAVFRKRSWLVCLCMPGCIFLTDRGVVKDALFLLHFPFLFLLICLFLFSAEMFHVAVKISALMSKSKTFEWRRAAGF